VSAAFGYQLGEGFSAFLLCYGLITVGSLGWTIDIYRGTVPGMKNHGNYQRDVQSRGYLAWFLFVALAAFYTVYYWFPEYFQGVSKLVDPVARLLRGGNAIWFVYSYLYTMAVLIMGIRMLLRFRHSRYQKLRTWSVMFFQLVLAFLIPAILARLGQPEVYLTYFWPLEPTSLYPATVVSRFGQSQAWGLGLLTWALVAIVILTPLLTYFFGKRWYCSWVCGCGGLAETLGDPFRHLSSKKRIAWRFELWAIHTVLVVIILGTVLLWVNHLAGGELLGKASHYFTKAYKFTVISLLAGAVGVAFYPVMGSRVWCRFFCPMAAILGLLQRYFSRFRITTNGDQCMSCGNCSTYCEMGIDVRSYAQRGSDIVRVSCVGCGLCSAVCPRGVLNLENGPTHKGRDR
jgi:polyferredoxin